MRVCVVFNAQVVDIHVHARTCKIAIKGMHRDLICMSLTNYIVHVRTHTYTMFHSQVMKAMDNPYTKQATRRFSN